MLNCNLFEQALQEKAEQIDEIQKENLKENDTLKKVSKQLNDTLKKVSKQLDEKPDPTKVMGGNLKKNDTKKNNTLNL